MLWMAAKLLAQPTACPTARPLPTYAPTPAAAYCTEKRFYVRACEASPPLPPNVVLTYTAMYTGGPDGFWAQICGSHTASVYDNGFTYAIVDAGPTSFPYPRPPD